MDPLRNKNLDVQDENQPNPVSPTVAVADHSARVKAVFDDLGLTLEPGLEPLAVLGAERLMRVAPLLKSQGFVLLDVIGIDFLTFVQEKPARFGVTYNLYHIDSNTRIFLRVYVADGESLPSLYPVWRSANYLEREVYDLVGVRFEGHPDLRKVLTPEDLEGHPLRKDFPLGESPTLFRDGRFIDPPAFRAGLSGQSAGLTGWRGGERKGFAERPDKPPVPSEIVPGGGKA